MNEWQLKKMGEIASFRTGKLNSNAAKENGAYPFFTCSRENFKTDTYSFDTEAVLLAGNNAAGVYPLKYFIGKFDAYQRTYIIETQDRSKLETRYLYYALRPQLEHLQSVSTGAATKFLTLGLLQNLELSIPSIVFQREIINVLSSYDDLIENNQRRIRILEDMAQSLYSEWFVHFRFPGHEKIKMIDSPLGPIPQGWKIMTVDDVLLKIKRLEKIKKTNYLTEGKWPIVDQGKSFIGGHTNNDEAVYENPFPMIVFGDHTRILKYIDFPFACGADGTQLIYPREKISLPIHFYHVLKGIDLSSYSYARHFKFLKAQEIIVSTFELVIEFENLCKPIYDERSVLINQITNLESTRDLILPKLTSGDIDLSAVIAQVAKAA